MQHLVRQHEVDDPVLVNIRAKVFVITSRESTSMISRVQASLLEEDLRSDAMVGIKHTRDAIKPKAVEMIFIHPKAQIR